jgi:hypothetical protein
MYYMKKHFNLPRIHIAPLFANMFHSTSETTAGLPRLTASAEKPDYAPLVAGYAPERVTDNTILNQTL